MSSLYSTTYSLKAHKRDAFIEFIKALLLTPFILHTRPRSTRETSTSLSMADVATQLHHLHADSDDLTSRPGLLQRTLTEGSLGVSERNDDDLNIKRYCEVLECVEGLIVDHILHQNTNLPELSRLRQLIPSIGRFFTPLPLCESFLLLNKQRSIAARRFVPPSFNDIRHMLNTAQVSAIAPAVKLITFDGDMTLYADGADFAADSALVALLVGLLRSGIKVAIVTAAGYAGDAERYEKRLSGLLEGIWASNLTVEQIEGFYVLGGECNYLFDLKASSKGLVYLPEETYQPESVRVWSTAIDRINELLDVAEACVNEVATDLRLTSRITIIRKPRSVGVVTSSASRLSREQLDEFVLSAQRRLNNYQHARLIKTGLAPLPFCAFNGGSDAWVDIGNKLIGVKILQEYLKTEGHETLHVGDQFLSTGNDYLTRSGCATLWITSPEETADVLHQLESHLARKRRGPKS